MRSNLSLAMAVTLAFAACGDDGATEMTDDEIEPVPTEVVTTAPERVRAGDMIVVTCALLGADGAEITPAEAPRFQVRFAPESSIIRTDGGDVIAAVAGPIEAGCTAPDQRLFDEAPPVIQIDPGPLAQLVTRLDRDTVTAGEAVAATCDGFDAFGNPTTETAPALLTAPAIDGNVVDGLSATMTRAGVYQFACDQAGVVSFGAPVEVVPALPSRLVISRVPSQGVYAIGEIIELAHLVTDRFDNPIPEAPVSVVSVPPAGVADRARFRYFADGTYTLTATVQGDVDAEVPLVASTTVIIDGNGPSLICEHPFDGQIMDYFPGLGITFEGRAADGSGISEVRVNGTPVTVEPSGHFQHVVPTPFGMNFVELSAIDSLGRESTRTCTFLISWVWAPENQFWFDAVTLKLRPAAVDDGPRTGAINSLGDMLHRVLNSAGLETLIHDELLRANPIKPSSCDLPGPLGTCILRTRIDYLSLDLEGPNTIVTSLISGGMRTVMTLRNAEMSLRITGSAFGIGFTTMGPVTVDTATVRMDFDVALSGGRPRIAVRPSSVVTTVGNVSSDFDGIDGRVVDLVVEIAQERVQELIENQVTNMIRGSFNDALDGIMAGLDITALGTSFQVPRLDGGSPITLTFTPGISSVSATSSRLLFGLSTRFAAPASHARPSLGAAYELPPGPHDATSTAPAAVAMHAGLLGQAVHALWRAGFLDATIDGSTIGGSFPAGASATLVTGLPPAVSMVSTSRVELALGNVDLTLAYPGLFPQPIQLRLGVRASLRFFQTGNDIAFDDFQIEELHLTSDQVSLDPSSKQIIEAFLTRVLERVIATALVDALPALPIPSFTLPLSLSDYNLPGGAEFGLTSPALSAVLPFFLVTGGLGVQ